MCMMHVTSCHCYVNVCVCAPHVGSTAYRVQQDGLRGNFKTHQLKASRL